MLVPLVVPAAEWVCGLNPQHLADSDMPIPQAEGQRQAAPEHDLEGP